MIDTVNSVSRMDVQGNRPGPARAEWLALLLGVAILFFVRVAFLPPTLDDIDAFNFDLGVHDYDPAAFRPHPPGYPVFILLAKLSHVGFTTHAAALAFVAAVFSSLTLVPLYFLMREFSARAGAALACVFTLASPVVWFNGVRPMSDATGLFAVLAAQWLLVSGLRTMQVNPSRARRLWYLGVLTSALAFGVRAQALFLIAPTLVYGCLRAKGLMLRSAACFSAAVAAWMLPVLAASGGAERYLQSLSLLLATALSQEPLLSAPSTRRAAYALWDVLGAVWGSPWVAIPMLILAGVGALRLVLRNREALAWLLLLFAPYAMYHYLFQMTATIRYAIPVVPLLAFMAAVPIAESSSRRRAALVATAALAFVTVSGASIWPALMAYHTTASPASQALAAVRSYAAPAEFVVAGNHMFERHLSTLGPEFAVLQSAVRRPWKPLVRYWKRGGRKPVLFLRNPERTTLLAVEGHAQKTLGRWRWPRSVERLMKGERPLSVELVRIDPPGWFVESGFLVSADAGRPEEVAREDHILHVRASDQRRRLIASGAVLGPGKAHIVVRAGDVVHGAWRVENQFSIRTVLTLSGPGYVPVSFQSSQPTLFSDVSVTDEARALIRPGNGFYPAEPGGRGRWFRWMAPAAVAEAFLPSPWGQLRIRGRIPTKYYDLPVTISLDWNGSALGAFHIHADRFLLECRVPAGTESWGRLRITSSDHFIPHERQKNGDMRVLSVQVYELRLARAPAVSDPGCSSGS